MHQILTPLLLLIALWPLRLPAQLISVGDFDACRVGEIRFERNWRTGDEILLAELEFSAADTVDCAALETSLRKIWNLGNFAEVGHRFDSLPNGDVALIIIARDAITVSPIFSGWGQRHNGALRLGLEDRNVLGRNIRVEGRMQFGAPAFGQVMISIPRQLLWRSMTLSAGFHENRSVFDFWPFTFDVDPGDQSLHMRLQALWLKVGNPFHEDFDYRFSPDLKLSFIGTAAWFHGTQHPDGFLPGSELPLYRMNRLELSVSEQFGTLTRRLHQEEGLQVLVDVAAARLMGDSNSRDWDELTGTFSGRHYVKIDLNAAWHRILGQRWQFSAVADYHASLGANPSIWNLYDGRQVYGLRYGELAQPLTTGASVALHYTWFTHPWLTLEQSLFLLGALGASSGSQGLVSDQRFAVGTGFQFTMPMYPKAGFTVRLFYSGRGRPWYFVEM